MKCKQLLLTAATALALGTSVATLAQTTTITFDPDGPGPGAPIQVNTFDWLPDNALAVDAIGPNGIILNTPFQVTAQAKLGTFVMPGNIPVTPPPGQEFTVVVSFWEVAVPLTPGSGTTAVALVPVGSLPSSVEIWTSPANSNQLAGTGYEDGTLILQGSVVSGSGTFLDFTRLGCPPPAYVGTFCPEDLDQFTGNDYPGVLTHQGNGSNTIQVDVTFAHEDYFITDVSGLSIDAEDTGNLEVPFDQADPAAQVNGFVPVRGVGPGGAPTNGANCAAGTTCDFQFQTDNATSFITQVPEPGSLALLGAALLGFGFARRRAKQA